jgi:hypothetical protein
VIGHWILLKIAHYQRGTPFDNSYLKGVIRFMAGQFNENSKPITQTAEGLLVLFASWPDNFHRHTFEIHFPVNS